RATKRPRRRPGQEQHGEPSGRLSDSPTSVGPHELGDPPNKLFPPRVADLDPKYVGADASSLKRVLLPLRRRSSIQSLAPALRLTLHWPSPSSCRFILMLSALLRAAFLVRAFLAHDFAPIAAAACCWCLRPAVPGGRGGAWPLGWPSPPSLDRPYPLYFLISVQK